MNPPIQLQGLGKAVAVQGAAARRTGGFNRAQVMLLEPGDDFELVVTEIESDWAGGLQLGFCWAPPEELIAEDLSSRRPGSSSDDDDLDGEDMFDDLQSFPLTVATNTSGVPVLSSDLSQGRVWAAGEAIDPEALRVGCRVRVALDYDAVCPTRAAAEAGGGMDDDHLVGLAVWVDGERTDKREAVCRARDLPSPTTAVCRGVVGLYGTAAAVRVESVSAVLPEPCAVPPAEPPTTVTAGGAAATAPAAAIASTAAAPPAAAPVAALAALVAGITVAGDGDASSSSSSSSDGEDEG